MEKQGLNKNLYAFAFHFISSSLLVYFAVLVLTEINEKKNPEKKQAHNQPATSLTPPNVPTALQSFRLLKKWFEKINSRMKSVFYPPLPAPPPAPLPYSPSFPITSRTVFGSHLGDWNQRATPALPRLQLLPNCHFDLKLTLRRSAFSSLFFSAEKKTNKKTNKTSAVSVSPTSEADGRERTDPYGGQ